MPLMFDMPLEQLYSYPGSNPRPADHDTYWAAALAELDAVDPRLELVPATFQTAFAECLDLFFTGVGGARIHAKLLRPRQANGRGPAVLMFHGYTASAGEWSDKLGYVAAGYTVAALDCRGQGGLSEDNGAVLGYTKDGHIVRGLADAPEKLLYRSIFLDTAELARIVMEMPGVDPERVGATGGSQGGGLTLACAALEPRIRRAAPIFPFLSDFRRVWEIDLARDAYNELREWFRRFDPRHEQEEAVFTRLGYVDVQHLAPRICAQTLMAVGLMDTICPPSSQFAAYNKIVADKSLVIYPDFGHEGLPDIDDIVFQYMLGL